MEDNTDEKENKEIYSEDEQGTSESNQNDKCHEEETKDRLETKLNEAYGKQDDLQNKYLRVHADLENIKKRSIKEREDAVQRTRSQIIGDLLPIIDSFKMGLAEASKHESAKTYVEGFSMAMNLMYTTLNEYGLHVVESTNKPFDPKIHDAISYENDDIIGEGIVIRTIREGYKLGDKLLRPASVILSKGKKEEN
mgnify:CR=1 FL=1